MKIIKVDHLTGYMLKVVFENGETRLADMEHFIKNATHPTVRKCLDVEFFAKVKLKFGHLTWGVEEMDICSDSVYDGEFNLRQ